MATDSTKLGQPPEERQQVERERKGKGVWRTLLSKLRPWCAFGIVIYAFVIQGLGSQGGFVSSLCRPQVGSSTGAAMLPATPTWGSDSIRSEDPEHKAKTPGQGGQTLQSFVQEEGSMAKFPCTAKRASVQGTSQVRCRCARDSTGIGYNTSTADSPNGRQRAGECRDGDGGAAGDSHRADAWHGQCDPAHRGYAPTHGFYSRTASYGSCPSAADGPTDAGAPATGALYVANDDASECPITKCSTQDWAVSGPFHSDEDESHTTVGTLQQSGGSQDRDEGREETSGHRGDLGLTSGIYWLVTRATCFPSVTTTPWSMSWTRSSICYGEVPDFTSAKPKSGYAESVSLRAVMAPCSMPSILWGVHRIDDEHYKDDDDTLRSAAWDCSASGTNESLAAFGAMTPRNRHMGFADSAPTAIPLTLPIPCGDQLHRDEVDDAFLDYDGLVLLQTNTVPFFMSSVIGCTASLSDDTSALTGILPPHLLNDEQANTDYEARWVWVVQQTALPRPEEHPDMRLFRVRIAAPPAIPDALINFPPGVDAWDSMDHLVTLWPDLRYSRDRIRWRAIKVHESVRFGLATDADIPSYIIVTEDERDVGPFRDVLVETQYHTHMSTTIDAAGRRLTSSLTFPSLLAQIGLIAPCSMTHECTAKKNGRPMPDHQGVRLLDGDFILVELLERPPARLGLLDDGSRGDAQLLEETTSQASSSSEAEYEGPAIYVVHRPRFRATDSRVCWIASDTRSTINELLIARHWPDLRNNEYYTLAVHKSLQRDMPDAPQIQHQIILPDVDFLPRPQVRGVLVYPSRWQGAGSLRRALGYTHKCIWFVLLGRNLALLSANSVTMWRLDQRREDLWSRLSSAHTRWLCENSLLATWHPASGTTTNCPPGIWPDSCYIHGRVTLPHSWIESFWWWRCSHANWFTGTHGCGAHKWPLLDMCSALCLSWWVSTTAMSMWTTTPYHQATSEK